MIRLTPVALLATILFGCAGIVSGEGSQSVGNDAGTGTDAGSGGGGAAEAVEGTAEAATAEEAVMGGDAGGGGGGGGSSSIPADRTTAWNPGILADGQLGQPLGADGIPQRTTVCATLSPGADIQAAINACPAGQVVQLAAGTFSVSSTITLNKGVVLRGAGYQGGPTGTTIAKNGGGTVIAIGTGRDSTCYGGTGYALTQDGAKEATTLSVGSAAANFAAGDLALVDVVDDSTVQQGDCSYYKRVSGRSASQRVEIKAVDGASGTLTLSSPLHWKFPAGSPYLAQITKANGTTIKWAGIEHLRIQGGTNNSYNGAMAGGIDISNAAYCWVKDVQTDGTIGGMHVTLTGAYRCVVRDSFIHHSANYGFGTDCYGIVLRCGSADNLVENNIVRWMNKPILFNASGGGNVVAYNYADNSWATPAGWQEMNIDCHCAFPHMELMEGNYAPHVGASTTHGNAGYLTYFRNYSSSFFAPPAVYGSTATQIQNITALQFNGGDIGMNVVGNVLGMAGVSTVYDGYDVNPHSIYQLGRGRLGRQRRRRHLSSPNRKLRHRPQRHRLESSRRRPDASAIALPPGEARLVAFRDSLAMGGARPLTHGGNTARQGALRQQPLSPRACAAPARVVLAPRFRCLAARTRVWPAPGGTQTSIEPEEKFGHLQRPPAQASGIERNEAWESESASSVPERWGCHTSPSPTRCRTRRWSRSATPRATSSRS